MKLCFESHHGHFTELDQTEPSWTNLDRRLRSVRISRLTIWQSRIEKLESTLGLWNLSISHFSTPLFTASFTDNSNPEKAQSLFRLHLNIWILQLMQPHILNFIIWTQEDWIFTDSSFTLVFYHADAYTKPTQGFQYEFSPRKKVWKYSNYAILGVEIIRFKAFWRTISEIVEP